MATARDFSPFTTSRSYIFFMLSVLIQSVLSFSNKGSAWAHERLFRKLIATVCSICLWSSCLPSFSAYENEGNSLELNPPISLSLSSASPDNISSEYVLGPGDELTILDPSIGKEDQPYSSVVPILPDGTISVFPVGQIQAAGFTLAQLATAINDKAKDFITNPTIIVQVSKLRPVSVHVLGEVEQPGLYNSGASPPTSTSDEAQAKVITTAAPGFTVLTALQAAGGFRDSADIKRIHIARNRGKQSFKVDFSKLLLEGDAAQDLTLRDGDVIFVHKAMVKEDPDLLRSTLGARAVRIFGGVLRPGLYNMTPKDDIFSAIAKAGGFTPTSVKSKVLLSRVSPDGTMMTKNISLTKALKEKSAIGRSSLMPGDVIVVHESTFKKAFPKLVDKTVFFSFLILLSYFNAFFNAKLQGQFDSPTTPTTQPAR